MFGRVFRVAAVAAFALLLWATVGEPNRLALRAVAIPVRLGAEGPDRLRVAAFADVHTGSPFMSVERLRNIVAEVNREQPDVVVLLGDYVIHGVAFGRFVPPEDTVAALGGLHPRLGIFAVLGNHDGWLGKDRVRSALTVAGIRVLENAAARVDDGGRAFWIAGLEDLWTGTPNVGLALRDVPPDAGVLLLTHNPDIFPDVPGRVSLTLAGHTHGGQVRLPWLGAPVVPSQFGQRYAAGLVTEGGRKLFVSTGLGTSILPVRFRVPPEVSMLTLEKP